MAKHDLVKIASTPEHYKKYGVKDNLIEKREDGIHTDGNPGNYEWWYFDANMDDGSNLVITFHTKPFTSSFLPLSPMVSMDYNGKDGSKISKMFRGTQENFSAAKDQCDVQTGNNEFKGDLKNYTIHIEIDDVVADIELKRMIPSWRPGAGMILYGPEEKDEYGWLVAVPKGEVTANITQAGNTKTCHGYGYHDHNWGNRNLVELKHHGYWGRAEVDGFTFINAVNYAPKEFGYQDFIMFMLADGNSIIADDSSKVTFTSANEFIDEVTHKPIAKNISYLYEDGDKKYRISYEVENVILQVSMLDTLSSEQKEAAIKQGMDPAYLRFAGSVTLEIFDKEQVVESHKGNAMWESMYFGNPDEFK